MEAVEKRIENQVQFWSLIGPFLILSSIAILLYKMSAHWYFPVAALVGIPLCVKWKMKGMAAALSCLFVLAFLSYQSVDLDEQYWHVGMALAMAFSLIVLTLSLEEVEGLMTKLQRESQSRLDNVLRLNESLKGSEVEWAAEKEKLQTSIAALTQDQVKAFEEKEILFKLAHLAKEELVQLHLQHHLLLEDLFHRKQQIAQLDEKLEETEKTMERVVNTDQERKIKELMENLVEYDHVKSCYEKVSQEIEELRQINQQLMAEQSLRRHDERLYLTRFGVLEQEKGKLQSALTSAQQQCDEIRKQESELRHHLHETLRKLEEVEKALADQVVLRQESNESERAKQELRNEILQLNSRLEMCQKQLSEKEQSLLVAEMKVNYLEKPQTPPLPYADGSTRHIEAMYLELKKQFAEKSDVLDKTRRELFVANEQLLKLQREREEENTLSPSEAEQILQKDLNILCQECDSLEQEVEELQSLVSRLLH